MNDCNIHDFLGYLQKFVEWFQNGFAGKIQRMWHDTLSCVPRLTPAPLQGQQWPALANVSSAIESANINKQLVPTKQSTTVKAKIAAKYVEYIVMLWF